MNNMLKVCVVVC